MNRIILKHYEIIVFVHHTVNVIYASAGSLKQALLKWFYDIDARHGSYRAT
jgi:hypothetical protein